MSALENQRSEVYEAIKSQAIVTSNERRLVSPSGSSNEWLLDVRKVLLSGSVLDSIADIFWDVTSEIPTFQIGGMEIAAIPLIVAIVMRGRSLGREVNAFIIRKERKTYGTGSLIEGVITDQPIVLVDDIINSGVSAEKSRTVLASLGRTVESLFVLIDYKSTKGVEWRRAQKVEVRSIFSLQDFGLKLRKPKTAVLEKIFDLAWRFQSPDPSFFHRVPKSFPAVSDGRIYFGSDSGLFWCLNTNDGEVVWAGKSESRGHKGIWSAPLVHAGKVYFGAYDGNVYCLDAKTGEEVWRNVEADWIGSSPAIAPDLGLLFIGLEYSVSGKKGAIAGLDLSSGEIKWHHQTKRFTHASPAFCPELGAVACGSNDNEMFLLDAATGKPHWRFQTRGGANVKGSIRHAPCFDMSGGRRNLVTGCADGNIYIICVDSGTEVWSIRTGNSVYTVPFIFGDHAYIGSTDKYLYILDLARQTVSNKIYLGAKIYSPPTLLNGSIYVSACNGMIYRIDPSSRLITGRHQLPDAITNSMTFCSLTGLYFALTYMNELYALRAS